AWADHGPGFGSGRQGRLDPDSRRRQEGGAGRCCTSRFVQGCRSCKWGKCIMELQVTTLEGTSAGKVTLDETVFGLEPRADLIQRMVRYQLLKRMAGTHDVKNRAEVALTGKKSVRQKGSGGARHGSRRANIFRGGGRAFGPTPRSHAIDLPKKVRALALKHALSAKAKAGELVILDKAVAEAPKTSALREVFGKLGFNN